jgi:hypothetical protein
MRSVDEILNEKLFNPEIAENCGRVRREDLNDSCYFKAAASCRTVEMNVLVARVRVRSRR